MFDVLAEVEAGFVQLPGYRLGLHVLVAHPGVMSAEHVERAVQELL